MAEDVPIVFEETVRKRESVVMSSIQEYFKGTAKLESEDKRYGLPIFWEIIQDRATNASQELTQQSINCLI